MIQLRKESSVPEREAVEGKFVKSYIQESDGVIDIEEIFLDNGIHSNYFISGPPAMIKNFKQTLLSNGVPTRNVLTDDWE